jgi:putative transposase
VIDLYSRRLLPAASSLHPDAELAYEAIRMAATVRRGRQVIEGVVFHTDYAEVGVKPRSRGLSCA